MSILNIIFNMHAHTCARTHILTHTNEVVTKQNLFSSWQNTHIELLSIEETYRFFFINFVLLSLNALKKPLFKFHFRSKNTLGRPCYCNISKLLNNHNMDFPLIIKIQQWINFIYLETIMDYNNLENSGLILFFLFRLTSVFLCRSWQRFTFERLWSYTVFRRALC